MTVDEAKLRDIIRSEMKTQFEAYDVKLELKLASFFGDFRRYFSERIDAFEERVDSRLDRMQITIDGVLDRLDTDEIERAALGVQLGRHDAWIHTLAKKTNTKLSAS